MLHLLLLSVHYLGDCVKHYKSSLIAGCVRSWKYHYIFMMSIGTLMLITLQVPTLIKLLPLNNNEKKKTDAIHIMFVFGVCWLKN